MTVEENVTPRHTPPTTTPDDARLAALLTATFTEQAERAIPAPDALVRLNTRLDAGASARPWWAGHLRLAGAVAVALLVLVLVTPVGRLAAAGIHNAAQAVVTTITNVKDFATGDGGNDSSSPTPNPPGTPAPTGAVNGSAIATSPTGSNTRPPGTITTGSAVTGSSVSGTTTTGTVVTGSATRTGTNAPGTATGTTSGTIVPGTPTPTTRATATATNTPVPTASLTAPTAAVPRVPNTTAPAVTSVMATPTIPPAPPTATAPRPPTATPTSVAGGTPAGAVVPDAHTKGAEKTAPAKGATDESAVPLAAQSDDQNRHAKPPDPPKAPKKVTPPDDASKPGHRSQGD